MAYAIPQRQTNVLAIVSLVLGILGMLTCWCALLGFPLGIAGIVTGLLAIQQMRASGQAGRGMAIAGIALSSACLVFACVFLAVGLANGFFGAFRDLRIRPQRLPRGF
jgi:hypothetical protein